ncbi:glycoside hydrolase [Hortaea werneckii]|nr:glycoside hydrolase [Hortaea werneckii]
MAPMAKHFAEPAWWKESVIYQVYPSSFKSTGSGNAPGWGDIKGITSQLDYLKHLGVDIIWSSPIFKSPQVDMGYDISDYYDIDPKYGTLEDVDELIRELKKRDMKLMMDLVVNHSSDQNPWFQESRSSKDNPKRDWYIWQPAKYDEQGNRKPPNNWSMILGEANSAWTWDEKTQEYYLALFTPEQPDLNWRNPDLRAAVHDVMKFWLDRGACGFRMDVINHISKPDGYPDAPITNPGAPYQPGYSMYCNGPHMNEYIRELNDKVLSKYDTVTVGEMPFVKDPKEIIKVVGAERKELRMIFIFDMVDIDNLPGSFRLTLRDWPTTDIRDIETKYQRLMIEHDGWNSMFIENHDNPRSVSRYTDDSDQYRDLGAKLLCLMQTTLSGTIYVYQGEELGMKNIVPEIPIEEYKDVESINYYKKITTMYPNDPERVNQAKDCLQRKARDHSRTPVQWSAGPNAGFCAEGVEPWMIVNKDYQTVNAEAQRNFQGEDQLSVLQFWKRGLQNRKDNKDVFVYGDYELLDDSTYEVFAYKRKTATRAFVTVLNFSGKEVQWKVPSQAAVEKWVAGNYTASAPEKPVEGTVTLRPWEGLLGTAKP